MAFYGYEGGVDERYSSAYDYHFGVAPQYSSSPYELSEPNLIDYSSSAYYKDNDFSEPINYTCYDYYEYPSQTSYSQPKFLQYEPSPHYQGYFPSETKFTISYSNVEFNEPEFEEYDPTPYDGGYDQRMTYGKPLPPSDLTCYPRSLPQSDTPPLENFSFDSIPSPYVKDDDIPIEPPTGRKPIDTKAETERHVENGGKVIKEPTEVISSGDYPPQIPYGSGLEAMDVCDSIFGYWPCLAKKAQQQRDSCQVCNQDRRMDPWNTAADYLFGTPGPYDYHHHHSDQISWLQ